MLSIFENKCLIIRNMIINLHIKNFFTNTVFQYHNKFAYQLFSNSVFQYDHKFSYQQPFPNSVF